MLLLPAKSRSAVEVHVDVDPLAEQTGRADAELVVEARRLEARPAAGVGIEKQHWAAALLAGPVGPDLQTGLAVDGEVRIFRGKPENIPRRAGASPGVLGQLSEGMPVEQEPSPTDSGRRAPAASAAATALS